MKRQRGSPRLRETGKAETDAQGCALKLNQQPTFKPHAGSWARQQGNRKEFSIPRTRLPDGGKRGGRVALRVLAQLRAFLQVNDY
jgi:hypothetical protein